MGSKKRGSLSYIGHTYIQDLSQQTKDHAQQICTHQLFTDQTLNQFMPKYSSSSAQILNKSKSQALITQDLTQKD
jgi:hypothetical protein